MNDGKIHRTVKRVVRMLVEGQYSELASQSVGDRLTAEDIERAVLGYGRQLVLPPEDATEGLNVIEITDSDPCQWYVAVDLWTSEEGRSDLTLEMTLTDSPGTFYIVELDDLHVL